MNIRKIKSTTITNEVKNLFIDLNYNISNDILEALNTAYKKENSHLGKCVLSQLIDNNKIAINEQVPICQDTGMAVLFVEFGENIQIENGSLNFAINEGIKQAYDEGYLRKSVVDDPVFLRQNTTDNTPCIIHTELVPGDKIKITGTAKGFGSENMSKIKMLTPSDGKDGVVDFVLDTVKTADANPCPPIIVGIGIGGTFEKAAMLSKKALLRDINEKNKNDDYANLEKEILNKINNTNIGPGGFGGNTTALGVNIEYFPTHIAGLPVAVNICCHASRHKTVVI